MHFTLCTLLGASLGTNLKSIAEQIVENYPAAYYLKPAFMGWNRIGGGGFQHDTFFVPLLLWRIIYLFPHNRYVLSCIGAL